MSYRLPSFARQSILYAMGNAANRAAAFVLLPIYTTRLSASEYGAIEMFYMFTTILASLLGLGLSQASLRFYYEYEEPMQRNSVISTALLVTFTLAVTGVLILVPFSHPLNRLLLGTESYSRLTPLVLITFVCDMSSEIGLAYFRVREYAKQYVLIALIKFVVQGVLNSLAVAVLDLGVLGVLAGNCISSLAFFVILTTMTVRETGLRFNWIALREMLRYTTPLLLSTVGGAILSNSDKYLIRSMGSLSAVGVYSLAQKIAGLLGELLVDPFFRTFGPHRFSIMKDANVAERLSRLLSAFVLTYGTVGLILISVAGDILRFVSAPIYWRASEIVPIISFSLLWAGLTYIFQTGLMYAKRTRPLFLISLLSNVSVLAFNILLVPRLDYYGAAISYLLSNIGATLATYWLAQRAWRINYNFWALYRIIPSFAVAAILIICIDRATIGLTNWIAKLGIIGIIMAVICAAGPHRLADIRNMIKVSSGSHST